MKKPITMPMQPSRTPQHAVAARATLAAARGGGEPAPAAAAGAEGPVVFDCSG